MPVERYRCRSEKIEAVRFDGGNVAELAELLGWDENDDYEGDYETVFINEGDGELEAAVGDYVVNGPDGVVILDPSEFVERYELDV